jgi:hypothetical protein
MKLLHVCEVILCAAIIVFLLFLAARSHYRNPDNWERGEYVTLRRSHMHEGCGGAWMFIGKSELAPLSDKDRFNTHVCDKCQATNVVLNAVWPEHKREWRGKKCAPLSRLF